MAVTEEREPKLEFAYLGLRSWLERVGAMGQLQVVHGASAEEEIGAATDVLQHHEGGSAVIFDQIPGYDPGFRVLVNALGALDRIALTLGLPLGRSKLETSDAWRRKIRNLKPLAAVEVKDGPVMENVKTGDDVDMTIFPAPKWHPGDGGRYIGTGSFDVTLDPDDGWVNLGTYRVMVHHATRLGYYISPGKHGRLHRQKYFDRGQRCPVAMVFGADPLLFLASCTEVPQGVSEYEWVGALRGQPQQVIRGPVTGLPLPADAEIVVEGFASPAETRLEGPFGEWTGYYASASREEPVLQVEALYHRHQPILLGEPPGQPPDEQSRYRAVLRSALLRDELEKAGIPDVVGAWQHEAGGSRLFTVVAIRQRYPGHTRQTLHVAAQCRAGAYAGRYTIVVDDDIDPSNLEEVIWALCTRSDPATSIDIINRSWSTPLDPRIPPQRKAVKDFTNSRALIDATRPWEWRDQFPPVNVPPLEARQAAMQRWGHLLRAPRVTSAGSSCLLAREVRISYWRDRSTGLFVAVDGVDLDVADGEFVSIVGPSGCGKTTFLNAVDGLIPISGGRLELNGRPVTRPGRDRAMVFQQPSLLPWRTVVRNITYGLELEGRRSRAEIREIGLRHLKLVGLEGFGDAYPRQLSGGMQQRANLARALATDPAVLLLDEPFASLDAQTRELMQLELLRIWRESMKTALFITHDIKEAIYLADRVIVFTARPGRVKEVVPVPLGRPRDLRIKRDPRFIELEDRVWTCIEEESRLALATQGAGS